MNKTPEWFDSHCHLDLLDAPPEQAISAANELGVGLAVTIGTNAQSNQWIVDHLPKLPPGVYGALGVHPHYASKYVSSDRESIRQWMLNDKRIVAVGECGFDFHYNFSSPESQRGPFIEMMELALELEKSMVIHSREAEQATMETMEPFLKKGLQAVLHSFTSNMELADFGIAHGCWFSFNGIATFPKSEHIRAVLAKMPRDKILLETDAPYLAPQQRRGKRNQPGWVSLVGENLAGFLGYSAIEFAELTTNNAKQFYRI